MDRYTVFKQTGTHADVLAAVGAADVLRSLELRIVEFHDRFEVQLRRRLLPSGLDAVDPAIPISCGPIKTAPHLPPERIVQTHAAASGRNAVSQDSVKPRATALENRTAAGRDSVMPRATAAEHRMYSILGRIPPYRATIAMREFVHYQGTMRLAFDLKSCPPEFVALPFHVAPAINYLGKRGSFVQYLSGDTHATLDAAFTQPVDDRDASLPAWGQRAGLDDFGARASFAALNSFAPTGVRQDIDRRFVETVVPLNVYNAGPGFVHYSAEGAED